MSGTQGTSSTLEERLTDLIRADATLMAILRAARDVALPDWLVGAGVIRDLVWDHLHGFTRRPPKDIDVVFFDPADLTPARDRAAQLALERRLPGVPWDATNQAAVHTWYEAAFGIPVEPLTSSADGVATWPETATSVAVRLDAHERFTVVAPCGLEDLFGLVLRRNPRRVTPEIFERRLREKHIEARWPGVRIMHDRSRSDRTTRATRSG